MLIFVPGAVCGVCVLFTPAFFPPVMLVLPPTPLRAFSAGPSLFFFYGSRDEFLRLRHGICDGFFPRDFCFSTGLFADDTIFLHLVHLRASCGFRFYLYDRLIGSCLLFFLTEPCLAGLLVDCLVTRPPLSFRQVSALGASSFSTSVLACHSVILC